MKFYEEIKSLGGMFKWIYLRLDQPFLIIKITSFGISIHILLNSKEALSMK